MPGCNETFENEVVDGKNATNVKCRFCQSIILLPSSATYSSFEYQLPLMEQKKSSGEQTETEKISKFWVVEDMFTFQNIGFSNTVEDTKYLTCADCDAGPIGYHDISSKISYVALNRVEHN